MLVETASATINYWVLTIADWHLREMIEDWLKQKHPKQTPPIPSLECMIHLQFWPANPYSERAIRYRGCFQVKFGIQVCCVRSFSVEKRSNVLLLSVDDKCIAPVEEPDCPVSIGVHVHNRSLIPLEGPRVVVFDHDFHIHGIVPSVAFVIDIPETTSESLFVAMPLLQSRTK